jgi:hypothetical protein
MYILHAKRMPLQRGKNFGYFALLNLKLRSKSKLLCLFVHAVTRRTLHFVAEPKWSAKCNSPRSTDPLSANVKIYKIGLGSHSDILPHRGALPWTVNMSSQVTIRAPADNEPPKTLTNSGEEDRERDYLEGLPLAVVMLSLMLSVFLAALDQLILSTLSYISSSPSSTRSLTPFKRLRFRGLLASSTLWLRWGCLSYRKCRSGN